LKEQVLQLIRADAKPLNASDNLMANEAVIDNQVYPIVGVRLMRWLDALQLSIWHSIDMFI